VGNDRLTLIAVGCLPPGVLATRIAGRLVVQPGRAARRSRANVRHPPPRSSSRRSHSPLTACPGPGVPATVGGGEGTRLRRVLLRWQAPQPCPARRATGLTRPSFGAATPTATPTSIPTAFPPPQMAYPLTAWRLDHCWSCPPLRGSGARLPQGALRAIDPCGRRAFLADLRSAPPSAAISA
jgi:hypothetical protein